MVGGTSGMVVSRGISSIGVNLYMIVDTANIAFFTASKSPVIYLQIHKSP